MAEWWYPTAFNIWGIQEFAAIDRVLESNRFTLGEECAAFEREFAAYHDMRYGIMVNSGSSANLIAVAALFNLEDRRPLRRDDIASVPAIAWSTTYAPLVQHGLQLCLSDCDDTWNAVETNGLYDARLIIGCSILGNPGYLAEWKEYAGINDAYFIEDNCESLGAARGGKLCGTSGIMNTFSFFHSHQISAIEGGMILTNDDECNKICRMLRSHGWTRDVEPISAFDQEYNFKVFGYNVRPLEMHAAIARTQLKKLEDFTYWRRINRDYFRARIDEYQIPVTIPRANGETNPFGLAFTVKDSDTRLRLVDQLRANHIDCRLPTGGSFRRHYYGRPWREQKTPVADEIHECGLFLGNAPYAIKDRIERAVAVMRDVLCP